ncbi:MAG: cytidylate kinase-like family protein [Bacteroidales bacterium]|nr:cytidylate kinase-like family protein [Bacteroidales bacterium]
MDTKEKFVITVAREVGSGGHTVGRKLAQRLGVHYSDKELIRNLREKFNLTTYSIEKLKGEKKSWLADFMNLVAPVPKRELIMDTDSRFVQDLRGDVTTDDIFRAESEILNAIADEDSCVIAGRSGFFVLKDRPNKLDVFITASRENRIQRIVRKQHLTETEAETIMDSIDQSRDNYVKRYTGKSRYDARNYDLVINADNHTEDEIVDIILSYIHT